MPALKQADLVKSRHIKEAGLGVLAVNCAIGYVGLHEEFAETPAVDEPADDRGEKAAG